MELELLPGSNTTGGDKFKYNKTIGFRTVELVQDPIGKDLGNMDNFRNSQDQSLLAAIVI